MTGEGNASAVRKQGLSVQANAANVLMLAMTCLLLLMFHESDTNVCRPRLSSKMMRCCRDVLFSENNGFLTIFHWRTVEREGKSGIGNASKRRRKGRRASF